MPAVAVRQLASALRVMEYAFTDSQRAVLLRQAQMIMRASEHSVPELEDLQDIRARYQEVMRSAQAATLGSTADRQA
jgi:hypothetical protein